MGQALINLIEIERRGGVIRHKWEAGSCKSGGSLEKVRSSRRPESSRRRLPATGFILCPPALMPAFWAHRGVQEIYRLAYEQARAAHRPSGYERLLRASCN